MAQPAPIVAGSTTESSGFLGNIDVESLFTTVLYKFIDFVEGVIIVFLGYLALKFLRGYLHKMEAEHEQQKMAINLIDKLMSGFIVIVSLTVALKVIGIDMTLLVSVLILGLSYGLQDVIKNYVAGIIIMFKAPFKVGDAVKVDKYMGKIVKIDFQSTLLKTWDNKMITLYNASLLKKEITNYYKLPIRRMQLKFKFGYGTNLEKLIEKILKICKSIPEILDQPKTKVIFKTYDGEGITLEVRYWVKYPSDILTTNTKVASAIHKLYSDKLIYMPFIKGIELGDDHSLETRMQVSEQFEQQLEAPPPTEKVQVEGLTPEMVQAIETDYDAE
jgi:small-conductance mechanosensitive channel